MIFGLSFRLIDGVNLALFYLFDLSVVFDISQMSET